MRKYLVKVNGTTYEVEVDEVSTLSGAAPAATAAAPVPQVEATPVAPAANPASVAAASAPAAPATPATAVAGSTVVKAPMPGTILKVAVAAGDAVTKNQVLCILEAMKMENEIVAPRDGVVAGVATAKGVSVQAGDPLVSLA